MESRSEVVPNFVANLPENTKTDKKSVEEEEVSITKGKVIEETVTTKTEVKEQPEEVEEVVEEVEEDAVEEDVDQKVTEGIIDTPDGGQTKTITVTTVKKVTPDGTKTVVTTSSVTKEMPTTTTTIITTIPQTSSTTDEVKIPTIETVQKSTDDVSDDKNNGDKKHENDVEVKKKDEEEVEEEEEKEDEEEVEVEVEEDDEEEQEKQEVVEESKIPEENETQPAEGVKEQSVVDAPAEIASQNNQNVENATTKQDNLNNAIKDIITSIDSNIKAEENIAALKERELELLKKQQELTKELERQKLLAQQLANENLLNQQQLNNNRFTQKKNRIPTQKYQPTTNVSKYSTFEEKQDDNVYARKSETFETRESTNVSKKIDLHKIFTPATDAEEILPKNRKLYASSAFYSPTLHPTVEDQVELARRISYSLSDISNQQSRGQSMYVNRKKRSVKWVHEGCGQDTENIQITNQEESVEEEKENNLNHHEKVPLKYLMNPSGQIRDINSLRESLNTETGLLSPDVSAEVVTALQAKKGKGAELFAKRRKVSEKWVVGESNVGAQSPSGLPDYHQCQQQPRPSTSPNILPAYTDAAKHRVQLNLHQEQLLEKYAKTGIKVVQTPWEAALNSGSASAAFVEENRLSPYSTPTMAPSPSPQMFDASQGGMTIQPPPTVRDSYNKSYSTDNYQTYPTPYTTRLQQAKHERQVYSGNNTQRELAYKPSIPQGWKAPIMSLPKDLYMPREIPLQSYAPPPAAAIPPSVSIFSSSAPYETIQNISYKPLCTSPLTSYSLLESAPAINNPYGGGSCRFSVNKPCQQGFSSTYGSTQPPKQQYLPPQSYQTIPQNNSHNVLQVNFNPSPLSYDKLAKFENQPNDDARYNNSSPARGSHLNVRGSKVRNTSPAPFAGSYNKSYTPPDTYNYVTPSPSPRSISMQEYSGHNTPTLPHPSISSNKILNAPSYNNSARGWGSSYQTHPQTHMSSTKPQMVNTASMPYTDF